jgi:hypothetical protein
MYGGGASDGGAAQLEKQRQAKIQTGIGNIDEKFSGFNDDYFNKVKQDYLNYATPQVMNEYQRTKNQLTYSLARNGLMKSGIATQRDASLNTELSRQETNLANSAQSEANTSRAKVSDAKTNVTNQLISSADPSVAATQAAEASAGLRNPSSFAPIGNLFGDWTNTYMANQQAQVMTPGTPNLWQMLSGAGGGGGAGSSYNVN